MGIIKVQLDFGVSDKIHSLSHSFFNNPPEGIEYSKSKFKLITKDTYSTIGRIRKGIIKVLPFISKLDKLIISLLRKESESDLIHFIFHLGNSKKKCIIDYEHAYNFVHVNDSGNKSKKENSLKKLNRGNIKYLIPIHNEALKSFKLFFRNEIKIPHKIISPTLEIPKEFRNQVEKKNKIIFVSTSNILTNNVFLTKGGLDTLNAFEHLANKYPSYEFIILGKIPEEFKKEFPKNIILKEFVPREEMWEIFNESKIFVQPSYHAPAMVYIEAMFFKLPIVTYDYWANDEYVDEDNGILIKPIEINHIDEYNVPIYSEETFQKIISNAPKNSIKLEEAIEKLINDEELRNRLGENGYERVTEGKFSIKERNKKLMEVYNEVLK